MSNKPFVKRGALIIFILALSAIPVLWAFAGPNDVQSTGTNIAVKSPAVSGNAGDFKAEPSPQGDISKPSSTVGAPQTEPTPIPGRPENQAALLFGESPSVLPPGMVKGDNNTDTVDGVVRGRSMIIYDPAPDKHVVAWLAVQEPNSGLKPIWQGRGWWLGPWEKKTVQINGVAATLASNVDAGTFEGKPYQDTWLECAWIKDGKEYQMLSINVTEDNFVKMASSIK